MIMTILVVETIIMMVMLIISIVLVDGLQAI